jgi:hypothetical protein
MDVIKIKKYITSFMICGFLSCTTMAGKGEKDDKKKNDNKRHNQAKGSMPSRFKSWMQEPVVPTLVSSLHKSESLSDDPVFIGFKFGENPSGPDSARHRNGLIKRTMTSVDVDLNILNENNAISDIVSLIKYTALCIVADELPSFVRHVINEFRKNGYAIPNMEESSSLRLFMMNEGAFAYSVNSDRLSGRERMAIRYFANNAVSGSNGFLYQVGLRAIDELILLCYGLEVKIPKKIFREVELHIRGILDGIGRNIINLVTNCLGAYANSHRELSDKSLLGSIFCSCCSKSDEMPTPMEFSNMCVSLENGILSSMGFDLEFINHILNRNESKLDREIDFSEGLPQNLQNMVIMMIHMNLANIFPSFAKNMIIDMLKNGDINSVADIEANIKLCLLNMDPQNMISSVGTITQEDLTILRRSTDAITGKGGLFNLIMNKVLNTIRLWCNALQLPISEIDYSRIKDFAAEVIDNIKEPTVQSLMFDLHQRDMFDPHTGNFLSCREAKREKDRKVILKKLKDDLSNLATKVIDDKFGKGVTTGFVDFLSTVDSAVSSQ